MDTGVKEKFKTCDITFLYSSTDGPWGWWLTHFFVLAVPGTHLEGQTYTHRARSTILPQTDHIWPQIPPQQKYPAQRSQTRYASPWLKCVHSQKHPRNLLGLWARTCYQWNADSTNAFVFQATSLSMRTWSYGWETLGSLLSWRQSNRGKS